MRGLLIVGIILGLFVLTAVLRKVLRRGGPTATAYVRLLKLTRGDDEMADRLIDAERERSPRASRERLAQLAIKRWQKDRGR